MKLRNFNKEKRIVSSYLPKGLSENIDTLFEKYSGHFAHR